MENFQKDVSVDHREWTGLSQNEILVGRMRNLVLFVFSFVLSGAPIAVQAAPIIIPDCNSTAFIRNAELLHQIAIIGNESRLTIEQYAREHKISVAKAKKKFAATGLIYCTTGLGTAQLTGKQNIITTSGHAFHLANCEKISEEECEIEFPFSSRPKKVYKIKRGSLVTAACNRQDRNFINDWAIAELQEAVPNVKPYKVPNRNFVIKEGTVVLQAAASTINFQVNGEYPFNLNRCTVRHKNHTKQLHLKTDCDSGGWASGAGQFIEDDKGNLVLAAIHVGDSDSNNKKPGKDYDPYVHFNVSRGVEGEFLDAIYEKLERK